MGGMEGWEEWKENQLTDLAPNRPGYIRVYGGKDQRRKGEEDERTKIKKKK